MPLFYFDTHDGVRHMRDDTGTELPDLETARKEAVQLLPAIARELLADDGNRRSIISDIRDETGRLVFTAHLSFMARHID